MAFHISGAVACAIVLVFITNLGNYALALNEYKVTQTEYGPIRGQRLLTLFDEKPYYSYRGVPYARPPLNELRFQPPQLPVPWTQVKDTLEYGSECSQNSFFIQDDLSGSEDCLFVNVFVPDVLPSAKLPVMVFVHGGGFYSGSSTGYGPDFLVEHDVILVTVNYRLGIFGFLSLGTAEYPGNMGLKDQRAALAWVQRNIENFGGDSQRVTLFGESAGGVSTHFHVLTSESQQLIQRAIIQSGSVLSSWGHYPENNQLSQLHDIARKLGVNAEDNNQLMELFLRIEPLKLIKESAQPLCLPGDGRKSLCYYPWGPVTEPIDSAEPFTTLSPEELLLTKSQHKIDTLFGYTSGEMFLVLARDIKNPDMLRLFDEQFEVEVPWKSILKYDFNSKIYKQISQEIREFYFPNGARVSIETLPQLNNLLSDLWFVNGVDQSAKYELNRSRGKIFMYRFSPETSIGPVKKLSGANDLNIAGTAHIDDLFYLFRMNDTFLPVDYESLEKDSIEVKLIRGITKLWADFARFGNPTHKSNPYVFKPMRRGEINFVDITNDGLVPGLDSFGDRQKFWSDLRLKYKSNLESGSIRDEL